MPVDGAAGLLEVARSDPRAALRDGTAILESARDRGDTRETVVALRALGEASRSVGAIPGSIEYLREAAEAADRGGLDTEAALARITAASCLFIAGRRPEALRALVRASRSADPSLLARIAFQRATIYSRSGRRREAEELYLEALREFVAESDVRFQAMTYQNLGMLTLAAGAVLRAGEYLEAARGRYAELGQEIQVAYVNHDLGLVAAYRGDITEALGLFDEAEEAIGRLGGSVAHVQAARCETMLSAGLFRESGQVADAAAERLGASGELIEQAEMLLVSANASILRGENRRAEETADRVLELLETQGRPGWQAAAKQTRLRACIAHHRPTVRLRDEAIALWGELERAGQFVPATQTALLAVDLSLATGDAATATSIVGGLVDRGPLELRVGARLGRALVRRAAGDRRGALAAARAGLALLDTYRDAVGATDVRAGMAQHGVALSQVGLSCALAGRRARRVFEWMELTRSHDLARRPLRPAGDAELGELLAELRHVSGLVREATPGDLSRLLRRQIRLQNRIRRRTHLLRGKQSSTGVLRAGRVIDELGDRTLVSFAEIEGELWSVVITGGRASLRAIGDAGEITQLATDCRRALDRAAAATSREESFSRAEQSAAVLGDRLLAGLPSEHPIVIVASAGLLALPWGLMPELRANPFSVVPSATSLIAADRRRPGRGVAVAAGPDLVHARHEARVVAARYVAAHHLPPSRARVGRVLESLDGVALAHVACHGSFNAEHGLFSKLVFEDGDLTLLDLHGLDAPPGVLILSACEAGLSGDGAGDELLSLSGSLLAMGSRAIVAATGRIPDIPVMPRLMDRFHGYLTAGDPVALGLAKLRTEAADEDERVAVMSFLCFGSNRARLTPSSIRS